VDPSAVIDGLGRYCSQLHLDLVAQVFAQDDGASAIRLVDPGVHKEFTRSQRTQARRERKEAVSIARDVAEGGDSY
jgi:hypothetical protein